jgi:putative membrane protein
MLAVVLAVLAVPFGPRAGDEPPAAPFDDAAFVRAVALGGRYEGQLSELVGSQTRNRAVRKYAAGIVAGRIVGGAALNAVAKEAGIELPSELDDVHRERYAAFKEYKGDDLDGDFVEAMAERHVAAVKLFTRASKEAKHPAVKQFARAALPRLQERLELAQALKR